MDHQTDSTDCNQVMTKNFKHHTFSPGRSWPNKYGVM